MSRSDPIPKAALRAGLVALAIVAHAIAQAAPADDAERARLTQERASVDARFNARLAECQHRFVVTPCVEDAKRDRRQGLDALRARQIVVDELRRKERSAARSAELSANAAEQARRESDRAKRPAVAASQPEPVHDEPGRSLEPRRPSVEHASASKRRSSSMDERASGAKGSTVADRAAKESRSRATFEARQQQAAEHREEVTEKAAKRTIQRPPAASLPLPKDIKPAP